MTSSASAAAAYKGFESINSFVYKGIPVHRYKSTRTGLTVAVAEIEVPLVNSFITIATEAADHDGCPHTLEHLIFCGSEDYPYKGVLDQLANRSYAQGTNAWTDVDHTCYTLTTAGSEGFLRMLPVYMDHIIYPTLTDSAFYTEVHHIDGEGEDAGVVYSEMQSSENTGSSKTYHAMMEAIYAGSGYGYNTGGRVANLRSLKAEKVRDYHRAYYRPNNIDVIITGKITPQQVIDSIMPIEEKILKKNFQYATQRPWTTPVPELKASTEEVLEFPSDSDDGAIIRIGWRAMKWEDFYGKVLLSILWSYLSESAVSPLQKEFVELEDPLAGKVDYGMSDALEISHYVVFSNIPKAKIDLIKPKFIEVLKNICKTGVDINRMQTVIRKRKVKHFDDIEQDPHRAFSTAIISDFLYSNSAGDLEKSMDIVPILNDLATKNSEFWVNAIEKYLLQSPSVTVIGKPSVEYGKIVTQQEEERLKKQKEELGEEKLEELADALDDADDENEKPIPEKILTSFAIPDVNKITSIPVLTYRNDTENPDAKKLAEHVNNTPEQFPFFIQFDHVPSEFVELALYLDTTGLNSQLRQYLELYLEALFSSPIEKQGKLISHEEVVQILEEETVDHSSDCGSGGGGNFSCGAFAQLLVYLIKVEKEKYERAIELAGDFLWNTKFTTERLKVAAQKLINDVSRAKRSAKNVTRAALKFLNFDDKNCNHNAANMVKQHTFLQSVMKRLEESPESVINDMNEFRAQISKLNTLRIHVIGDMFAQASPKKPWFDKFIQGRASEATTVSNFAYTSTLQRTNVNSGAKKGVVASLKSTDSSYFLQSTPSLKEFNHKDRAALLVLLEYLTGLEGPFWKSIRGKGLAYSYSIVLNIEEGLLTFILSQSASLVKAYNESKKIVAKFIKSGKFNQTDLEAARSGVIFELIAEEETIHSAADTQFQYYLERVPAGYNKVLRDQVSKVTAKDLKRVLEEHVAKLFEVATTQCSIVTNPTKLQDIKKGFQKEKRTLEEIDIETFFLQ